MNKTNMLSLVYLIEQIARTRMNIHSSFSLTQRVPGQIPCYYENSLCKRARSYMERKQIYKIYKSVYYDIYCIENISYEGVSLYKLYEKTYDVSSFFLDSSLNKLCKYLNELNESGRDFAWYRRKHMIIYPEE